MISVGKHLIDTTLLNFTDLEQLNLLARKIDQAIAEADRKARSTERKRCHRLVLDVTDEIEHMGLDA